MKGRRSVHRFGYTSHQLRRGHSNKDFFLDRQTPFESSAIKPNIPFEKHSALCHVCQLESCSVTGKHSSSQFLILSPPELVLIILQSFNVPLIRITFHLSNSPWSLLLRALAARSINDGKNRPSLKSSFL